MFTARFVLLSSAGMLAALAPSAGHAQEAGEDTDTGTSADTSYGDVIVVTAQKRAENLAEVPMSITAISGDNLVKSGVSEAADLVKVVPGFNYQQGAFGTPILSIRGIGYADNSASAGPAVTAYVDQVALPYSSMTRGAILDLERVEVLKGPQGTLFGMNSTGGAINFIAARPTDHLEAGVSATYGRFNEFNLEGFVSGALAPTLAARLAVQYERRDGWQYSTTRPNDRLGKVDFLNGRLLLDWEPSDRLTLQVSASAWRDRSESQAAQFIQFTPAVPVSPLTQYIADAMQASPPAGENPREADWDAGADLRRDDDFYQLSLRADLELSDDIALTSITAWSKFDGNQPIDIDGTAFNNFLVAEHPTRIETLSQELRLSGSLGIVDWMVGGNFQDEDVRESTLTIAQGTNGTIGPFIFSPLGQLAQQDIQTISAFGSLDVHLTDDLTLQGSIRYASQERDFAGCISDAGTGVVGVSAAEAFSFLATILSGNPTVIPAGGCVTLDATTFQPGLATSSLDEDNVSWRIGVDYSLGPDALLYANVTRGYKAGSYGLVPAILSSQFTPVTQESVLAYEIGSRFTTADDTFSLEIAAFYNDYRDKQLQGIVLTPVFGPLPQLVNIPESKVYGFEATGVARPIDGMRFSLAVTHVRSEVLKDPQAPAEPRDPFGALTTYVGESFPNTPQWQVNADAEYRFPLGSGALSAMIGASGTMRSSSPAAFGENPIFQLPSQALLDLRAGIENEDAGWSAQVWGRNVTNAFYYNNVTHLTDYVSRLAGMPATYGLTFSFRY